MLRLKYVEQWHYQTQTWLKVSKVEVIATGEIVINLHLCPRCSELECWAVTAIETDKGSLFMYDGDLNYHACSLLREATAKISLVPDLPCKNHDGVQ